MVVNSFNSLFYMAFYDDSYENNEERLESLRIQLIIISYQRNRNEYIGSIATSNTKMD